VYGRVHPARTGPEPFGRTMERDDRAHRCFLQVNE
jgi:hypothetical protein